MRCFGCGLTGHLVKACPEKIKKSSDESGLNQHANTGEGQPASENAPVNEEGVEADGVQPSGEGPLNINLPDVTPTDQSKNHETVDDNKMNEAKTSEETNTESSQNSNASVDILEEASNEHDSQNMETETNPFKIPKGRKRARGRSSSVPNSKKKDLPVDDAESEGESSDCSLTCSLRQSGYTRREYSVDDIKTFLRKTKNAKLVQIDEYFPDVEQFMEKTKVYMSEGNFTKQEGY